MGQKLCWDRWKNIISGKIDSSYLGAIVYISSPSQAFGRKYAWKKLVKKATGISLFEILAK